jgi:hypothetical protein
VNVAGPTIKNMPVNINSATLILQNAVRFFGTAVIVLGILFWTGHAFDLVALHMGLGFALVAMLWILAALGFRAGLPWGLVISSTLWGLVVVIFGMTMGRLLPGRSHEIIRVVHFLIGLMAIGLSESLASRIKRRTQPFVS